MIETIIYAIIGTIIAIILCLIILYIYEFIENVKYIKEEIFNIKLDTITIKNRINDLNDRV